MTRVLTPVIFRVGILALVVLALFQPSPAHAHDDAVVGIYLVENLEPTCRRFNDLVDCEDESVKITGELNVEYTGILCVFNGDSDTGIGGVELGLEYGSGIDMGGWLGCSDLEFSANSWPASGGINRLTWSGSNCKQEEPGGPGEGVTALVGFFTLEAFDPEVLYVREHTGSGALSLADCNSATTKIDPVFQAGSIGFSEDGQTSDAKLPCGGREVTEASWGEIKGKYGN